MGSFEIDAEEFRELKKIAGDGHTSKMTCKEAGNTSPVDNGAWIPGLPFSSFKILTLSA